MATKTSKDRIIEISNIDKWYLSGEIRFHALSNVSLTINRGEFVAIIGPSGSGKSTLMNIIGCLDTYEKGSYKLLGKDVKSFTDKDLAYLRGDVIGFVFQTFNLLERYSVLENVMLPSLYVKIPDAKEKALTILEKLGLEGKAKNFPSQISGGQKQRVAIARALMGDPEVILADEPTGNLDSASGQTVLKILEELNAKGKTVILITHDPNIAKHAKRIVQILDGRIVDDSLN